MSWSRSGAGTPAAMIDRAERWAAEIDALDVAHAASDAVRAGHQAQVAMAVETLKTFADRCAPGFQLTVTAGGHAADADEQGAASCYCNVGAYLPVPVAAMGANLEGPAPG
jgi:hypothetical protein